VGHDSTAEEEARAIELDAFEVSTRSLGDGSHIVEVKARMRPDLLKPSRLIGEDGEPMGILAGRLTGNTKVRLEVAAWALCGGEPGKGC
jgi:hypothetical protein